MNRTICNMLKSLSETAKRDWKQHLPKLAFAYNSTVHKTTGFSPFYLMFGRESRLPIDSVFQCVEAGEKLVRKSHEQFVQEWKKSMEEACRVARENIEKSAEYNKKYYDKKAKSVEISVGDHVLMENVREKGGTGKLKSFWEENIFSVTEKKEGMPVYTIKNLKKPSDTRVVHRNLLMRCEELPLDVFDAEREEDKKKKEKNTKCAKKEVTTADPLIVAEEDGEDCEVVELELYQDETLTFSGGEEDAGEDEVEDEVEAEEIDIEENEDEINNNLNETVDEVVDEAEDESSSSDDDVPQRRSIRATRKPETYTYDVVGGDPVWRR